MKSRRPDRKPARALPHVIPWTSIAVVACLAACSTSSGSSSSNKSLSGTVTGPSGVPVSGGTVYLVPNTAVPTAEITAAGVLAGSTVDIDEPLEDAVATQGSTFPQAVTSADGKYKIDKVPDGRFFIFVAPAYTDTEHLPGGSLCRVSVDSGSLRGTKQDIVLSSSPPADATYVGMSGCLVCHPGYDTEEQLAHRLGFRVPGVSSPLQDTSYHPEIDDGLAYFLSSPDYTGGTPVYHYDYDATRGFDKYETSLSDPTGSGGVVSFILWLWQDSGSNEQKITFENVGNPGDPNNLAERVVKLTYGGAVEKQRYMLAWPGLNGLYPVLQFQTDGNDSRYDRTRRVFRDYHLDFYVDNNGTTMDVSDDVLMTPDITNNISRNCLGCHAADYERYTDGVTGEVLAHTLQDPNGEYDIDGDGFLNDLNTGCESCHGPGSEHILAQAPRYIVLPEYLSPSRDNQLCGRCHDRQVGADGTGGEQPLNAQGQFAPPGISRGEFLDEYVTQDGPSQSSFWPDFAHSKSHHQQYSDFIKSPHYRNPYRLLSCSSCHDMHGPTASSSGGPDYPRALVEDPDAPDSPLCMRCHGAFVPTTPEHTLELLGVAHGAATAACVDCHMNKTAKSGSGNYGYLLSPPTGTPADSTETYFQNDITSHLFDVPRKTNAGVEGVEPQSAMPIPYTQACGTCHDPSSLQDL